MQVLSIIIPVYNEIETLAELLSRVRSTDLPNGIRKEIIIVDDGSTDGTREYLASVKTTDTIIFQSKNLGKGAAIRAGLREATGDFIIIQDADLEYKPEEYPLLLSPLLDGSADIVYGSRFMHGWRKSETALWHFCINKALTLFSNLLSSLHLSDMETCYKMFTRKVGKEIGPKLVSNRFDIEPELTARIARAGYRVQEIAVTYRYRPYGKGKKIGLKDGFATVWAIIYFNLLRLH